MSTAVTATMTGQTLDAPPATGNGKPPAAIFPHHWQQLQASGLTAETIRKAGIYSESKHERLALVLNRKKWFRKWGAGLVFPYHNLAGDRIQAHVKPDNPPLDRNGKPQKYLHPSGGDVRVYMPADVRPVAEDPKRELLITEGEKKALCGTQYGFPTVGLAGVEGWHKRQSTALLPDLDRFVWKGRKVFVVFDSDLANNANVQTSEELLAAELLKRGAVVKVARLPDGPNGEKVGLDDYLVANGPGGLRKLLDAAEDPAPPSPGMLKMEAKEVDPAGEAETICTKLTKDGVCRLRFHRGSFHYWENGAYLETHTSEVRAEVIKVLNTLYFKLRSSIISDVVDQLRAQSILPFHVEPPAWLHKDEQKNPWKPADTLSTKTGLIHLPSLVEGKDYFRAPTPRFFTPTALDYGFDVNAPKPENWLTFMDQLFPDAESIATLQEWFGYCATLDTSQQKILMLIGPTRAGKGVIARVLRALIGPRNVAGPTLASLGTNFGLWPLLGKTAAIIADARLGGRTDSGVVVERLLSISGEDAITVDRKMQEPVTGKLNTRLLILSNELPRLGDASGALAGRMILLRLTQSFYGREDRGLTDRLLTEMPGILNWSIIGWQRLRERGHFLQPPAAGEMLGALHDLGSPVAEFLREQCLVGPEHNVPRQELFQAYKAWAEGNGRTHIEDEAGFGRNLRAVLPSLGTSQPRIDGKQVRCYCGVGLTEVGFGD